MNVRALASDFQATFSREVDRYFFSPGRINILGEHTDYNGGHVLPCAISLGTYGAVSKRNDRLVRVFSKNFSEQGIVQFTLDELNFNPIHGWANYPKGLLHFLQKEGHSLTEGFDLLLSGNLPLGAGLSSSSSLLMLIGEMANKLYNLHLSRRELISACRAADHDLSGTHNGVVDPFIVAKGKINHVILLESHTLSYEYIPLPLQPYKIIVMNTNKRDEQIISIYNRRLDECEHALRHLQGAINILSLGELNTEQFENFKELIPTGLLKKRARHVVTENERALNAVRELKRGNLSALGKLMNESHLSLRNDYEVTGTELNTLVEAAWEQSGVLGAKMTGTGGGGCAIALVEENAVDSFVEQVGKRYRAKIGYDATFYVTSIEDGVKELNFGAVR